MPSGLEREILTRGHAVRMETTLRGSCDGELAELLWKLRRRQAVAAPARAALQQARELEFVELSPAAPLRLTPLGAKVSDSLSEYAYWKQRGRRHHWSEEVGALRIESLRGRRILEIGCGAGVNLLSLQRCAEVVGIDVEPLYLQVAEVLARLEGVPVPTRVCALAEHLPFEDESFDVALFHGSLPYMRIERALCEAARVLRPGGRAIAIHSDLWQILALSARRQRWRLLSPGVLLRELRAAVGSWVYPWFGRLLLAPFAPVHATRGRTHRWLERAGLRVLMHESGPIAHEVCFVAEKPAGLGRTRRREA